MRPPAKGTRTLGETVEFINIPLTDLSVSSTRRSTVAPTAISPAPRLVRRTALHNTHDASGDGSLALTDLEPGTYNCEVVIDP